MEGARNRVEGVEGELEELRAALVVATDALEQFVAENAFFFSGDLTVLEGSIREVTGGIETLKRVEVEEGEIARKEEQLTRLQKHYQLIAYEELGNIEERLTALQSQGATEEAVTEALEGSNLVEYVELVSELAGNIQGLTGIWVENLQESHDLTASIWQGFTEHGERFTVFTDSVDASLGDDYLEYELNKLELAEAIQREVALEAYGDRLAESVDETEETIELLELQIEQSETISAQLQHISNLRLYEEQYAGLQSGSWSGNGYQLRNNLITVLSDEVTEQVQELSEEALSLQGYLEQRQASILDKTDAAQTPNAVYNPYVAGIASRRYWGDENHSEQLIGDFNGDGRDDVLNLQSDGNHWKWVSNNKDEKIDALQFLRVELAHLALTAETEPDKVKSYLRAYEESDKTESAVTALRNQYFPELTEAAALDTLQTQINQEVSNNQQQLEQLKASINEKQAGAAAALSQADWYEEQAATHWELSRKQGPTWTEYRETWKRNKSGRRKRHVVTVTHVDHDWITWDTYTKQAANLRDYAQDLLNDVETETAEKDTTQEILDQWLAASSSADAADLAYSDLVNQLQGLEAERQLTGEQQLQLDTLKELLPTLLQQLTQAQEQVEAAKGKVALEWEELESSEEAYQDSLGDVLTRKAELETKSQQLLLQIASGEEWARQERVELATEIAQTTATRQELEGEIANIEAELESATETDILQSQIAQLQKSVDLLTHKETVLTSHKANLAQKQTLLNAQREVILKEEELLAAYLANPDRDYSYLEAQLEAARALLVEVEALAQQAEA
ncbi:MAG: hypothetical protein GDA44_09355, partial [Prochloron sp. SP5CPC1]|nr:hypothetical protein [Candidatus Paraprochloron terpiosi SP5CPC1]